MKLTADESAAVALAFAVLRAQAEAKPRASRPMSRWSARSARELDPFDGAASRGRDGSSSWTAAARLEALGRDV